MSSITKEFELSVLIRPFRVEMFGLSLELLLQDTWPILHNFPSVKTKERQDFSPSFDDKNMTPLVGFLSRI